MLDLLFIHLSDALDWYASKVHADAPATWGEMVNQFESQYGVGHPNVVVVKAIAVARI